MNKKSLLLALILICMASVQCTEDETVEASVAHSQMHMFGKWGRGGR